MWHCSACQVNWLHHSGRDCVISSPGCCACVCDSSVSLPHTGGQAAEEEGDVALDEGREEGKHAVDGEGDEEGLPSSDPISQPAPHEGPDHHPEVHDQTWGREKEGKQSGGRKREDSLRRRREEEDNGRGMWWEEIMRVGRETEDMIMRYYSSVNSLILLRALASTLIKFPMASKLAHLAALLDNWSIFQRERDVQNNHFKLYTTTAEGWSGQDYYNYNVFCTPALWSESL